MWLSEITTRNFAFEAYGSSEYAARLNLIRGLFTHGRQCELPDGWYTPFLPDIESRQVKLGVCYRDREPLTPLKKGTDK